MKTVLTVVIAGMLALGGVGCAAGSDGTGDTNLSTEQGGTVAQDPNADQIPAPTVDAPVQGEITNRAHTNQFDQGTQIIPNRPSHHPSSPDPGPQGPGGPAQLEN